jgi:hypothetical protein
VDALLSRNKLARALGHIIFEALDIDLDRVAGETSFCSL